jgi:flagellar FliJ protein
MSPKPFSLDSILKYRKREKDLALEKVVRAQLAVKQATVALESAKNEQEALIVELETRQIDGISVEELSRYEERIQYQRGKILALKKNHESKQKILQQKRLKLLEKAKDHKTLTALKEQQNRTWKEYINKKEAAMLDEIAILHHDREIN